jgi:intergrase/recombinase
VAATFLADLQVPEAVAKSILGHQSSALVSYYGRDTSKKNREAIEKYAEQLSNPRK